jgi:NAD(P)-dependent dehydrogenase (short-subunit alcohol dehydrogenase family)
MPTAPTVLITGAARRIGRVLALDFGKRGWRVALHCRESADDGERLAREIAALGGEAAVLHADLADAGAVERLIPQCAAALAAPVCLINNAASFVDDEVETLDIAVWDEQMAVNLRAPVLLAKAFATHLPPGAEGNVINMIDQRIWKPAPHFFSYTASKAGLWAVTRTLAQALAPRIRVNAIGPGPALQSAHQTAAEFASECAATPLGRGTTPEEIAGAVRFILDASAMTGQMIALDGGQHLAWDTARPSKKKS